MHGTQAVFDLTASGYDVNRARLIPGFDDLYGSALRLLPANADHVLDLGAGTGLLSALVRERLPEARLRLVDNSPAMLAQAGTLFARDQEVFCQLGDYTTCEWGASYDAIVSALSIHHLTDAAKRELFGRICAALKPGGIFINAEQVLQPTAELEKQARIDWLTDVRRLGATDAEIEASLLRQSADRCATVDDQLAWLTEAGFHAPQCNFQHGRFAVLSAVKP